jgi:hypothetical protein
MGCPNIQQRATPIGCDIHRSISVIYVRQILARQTLASLRGHVPREAHRPASKYDVEEGDGVHEHKECCDSPKDVRVDFLRSRNPHKHEGDGELDGNDCHAEEAFEKEEPL